MFTFFNLYVMAFFNIINKTAMNNDCIQGETDYKAAITEMFPKTKKRVTNLLFQTVSLGTIIQ